MTRDDKKFRGRLLKLAEFLRTVPSDKFNMETFSSPCGTTACAAGWACEIPSFKRAGLHWLKTFGDRKILPVYGPGKVDFELFFGLDWEDKDREIFYGEQCTPKQFAGKLEALVKKKYGG